MLRRRRSDVDLGSGMRAGVVGALLNSRFLRFFAIGVIPLVSAFVFFDWLRLELDEFFPTLEPIPDWAEPMALIVFVGLFGFFVVIAATMAAVILRLGHEVFDVGLPALLASVSVGPRTPDWVGSAAGDHVVRLSVPEGISTTKFHISDETRNKAIDRAYSEARQELHRIFPERSPQTDESVITDQGTSSLEKASKLIPPRLGFAVLLFFLVPLIAVTTLTFLDNFAVNRWLESILAGAVTAALVLLGLYQGARVRSRELDRGHKPAGLVAAVAGIVLAAAAAVVIALVVLPINGSVSRLAHTQAIEGRVVSRHRNIPLGSVYDVQLVREVESVRFGGDGTAKSYCGSPPSHACITFESLRNFHVGSPTKVLFVHDTHELLLGGEQWSSEPMLRKGIALAILAVFITYVWWAIRRLWVHLPAFGGE